MATFGFSVGDFLAALKLVGTIIDGLRASGHSSTRFRSLLSELYTLEDALIRVKRLDVVGDGDEGSQALERIALQQAAALCQRSMHDFYKKIEKYQPHLTMHAAGGGKNWLKDGWMKIKWATCQTEDVELFQAELRGHRGSIEILLLTLQLNRSSIQAKAQEQRQRSLAGKIQDLSSEWMGKLANLSSNVASCMEQGKQLVELTAQILRTNIQLFQHIREIQNFITRIQGRWSASNPFISSMHLGKRARFILSLITGFHCDSQGQFQRHRHRTTNDRKGRIRHPGERLTAGNRPYKALGDVFLAGIESGNEYGFSQQYFPIWEFCPRCDTLAQGSLDEEIECKTCGMVFRRIEDLSTGMAPPIAPLHHGQSVKSYVISKDKNGSPLRSHQILGKRKRKYDFEDEIINFRRVRIKGGMSSTRCKVYEHGDNGWFDHGTGSCHYLNIDGLPHLEVEPEILYFGQIRSPCVYQIVQETLIIWTELDGTDVALSFQDSEGCAIIW